MKGEFSDLKVKRESNAFDVRVSLRFADYVGIDWVCVVKRSRDDMHVVASIPVRQ